SLHCAPHWPHPALNGPCRKRPYLSLRKCNQRAPGVDSFTTAGKDPAQIIRNGRECLGCSQGLTHGGRVPGSGGCHGGVECTICGLQHLYPVREQHSVLPN